MSLRTGTGMDMPDRIGQALPGVLPDIGIEVLLILVDLPGITSK